MLAWLTSALEALCNAAADLERAEVKRKQKRTKRLQRQADRAVNSRNQTRRRKVQVGSEVRG